MRRVIAIVLATLLATAGLANAQTAAPATGTAPATTASPTTTASPDTTAAPAKPTHHRKPKATDAATTAAPATTTATGTTATPSLAGSPDEMSAKQKCGSDPVVWANSNSKVFHASGSRYYGKTKKGSFMCTKDALSAGYHAAKKSAVHAKAAATTS